MIGQSKLVKPDLINTTNLIDGVKHFAAFERAERPRLLLLTQVLPFPPEAGPKIKTFNLIKYLSRSFSITLVSFVRPDNTPEHISPLLEYCEQVHTVPLIRSKKGDGLAFLNSLFSDEPFLMRRDRSEEMWKLLKELVASYSFVAVHADQLNMAQYAVGLPLARRVLDQHNAVWAITDRLRQGEKNPVKRLVLELETAKLRRYEPKICHQFEVVLAVSKEDEKALNLPCEIIPIGVDVEETEPLRLASGSLNLVSLGTMFYPPNIEGALWFGREVFPLVLQKQPRATYTIVGPRPPASIYKMAEENSNIRVTGYVKDLRPVLENSAGLVVPLLAGGGMRVKILEALALGLPIVSTTIGAEGIQLNNGQTALLADTPRTFAEACLELLAPDGPGSRLAEAGRQLALQVYDFRRAYSPLDRVYSNLLAQ